LQGTEMDRLRSGSTVRKAKSGNEDEQVGYVVGCEKRSPSFWEEPLGFGPAKKKTTKKLLMGGLGLSKEGAQRAGNL